MDIMDERHRPIKRILLELLTKGALYHLYTVAVVGLFCVDGILSRDDGDLNSITPLSFLISSARLESTAIIN